MHTESHPLAGETVKVRFKGGHPQAGNFGLDSTEPDAVFDYRIENWWDKLTGKSWMLSDGNPAALVYAIRSGTNSLPPDDEVVYGKVDNSGHLVHVSEIVVTVEATAGG